MRTAIHVLAPSRAELAAHLTAHAIAGAVATLRENNLEKIHAYLAGGDDATFGITAGESRTFAQVLDVLHRKVGINGDSGYTNGPDHIDVERTLDRLAAMRTYLRDAIRTGADVVVATGHPGHLLDVHLSVADALSRAGCRVLTAPAGNVRVVRGVHVLGDIGALVHTHSPVHMRGVLARLAAQGLRPGLVVADHGWAGAAAQDNITTVGFADSNDPALFVGEQDGVVAVAVPLDDGIDPHLYAPMAAYLLEGVDRG